MEKAFLLLCMRSLHYPQEEKADRDFTETWTHDNEWNSKKVELQDFYSGLWREIILMPPQASFNFEDVTGCVDSSENLALR